MDPFQDPYETGGALYSVTSSARAVSEAGRATRLAAVLRLIAVCVGWAIGRSAGLVLWRCENSVRRGLSRHGVRTNLYRFHSRSWRRSRCPSYFWESQSYMHHYVSIASLMTHLQPL